MRLDRIDRQDDPRYWVSVLCVYCLSRLMNEPVDLFYYLVDGLADCFPLESIVAYLRLQGPLQRPPRITLKAISMNFSHEASLGSGVPPPRVLSKIGRASIRQSTVTPPMAQQRIQYMARMNVRDEEARPISTLQTMLTSSWSVFEATNLWEHTRMSLKLSWTANRRFLDDSHGLW